MEMAEVSSSGSELSDFDDTNVSIRTIVTELIKRGVRIRTSERSTEESSSLSSFSTSSISTASLVRRLIKEKNSLYQVEDIAIEARTPRNEKINQPRLTRSMSAKKKLIPQNLEADSSVEEEILVPAPSTKVKQGPPLKRKKGTSTVEEFESGCKNKLLSRSTRKAKEENSMKKEAKAKNAMNVNEDDKLGKFEEALQKRKDARKKQKNSKVLQDIGNEYNDTPSTRKISKAKQLPTEIRIGTPNFKVISMSECKEFKRNLIKELEEKIPIVVLNKLRADSLDNSQENNESKRKGDEIPLAEHPSSSKKLPSKNLKRGIKSAKFLVSPHSVEKNKAKTDPLSSTSTTNKNDSSLSKKFGTDVSVINNKSKITAITFEAISPVPDDAELTAAIERAIQTSKSPGLHQNTPVKKLTAKSRLFNTPQVKSNPKNVSKLGLTPSVSLSERSQSNKTKRRNIDEEVIVTEPIPFENLYNLGSMNKETLPMSESGVEFLLSPNSKSPFRRNKEILENGSISKKRNSSNAKVISERVSQTSSNAVQSPVRNSLQAGDMAKQSSSAVSETVQDTTLQSHALNQQKKNRAASSLTITKDIVHSNIFETSPQTTPSKNQQLINKKSPKIHSTTSFLIDWASNVVTKKPSSIIGSETIQNTPSKILQSPKLNNSSMNETVVSPLIKENYVEKTKPEIMISESSNRSTPSKSMLLKNTNDSRRSSTSSSVATESNLTKPGSNILPEISPRNTPKKNFDLNKKNNSGKTAFSLQTEANIEVLKSTSPKSDFSRLIASTSKRDIEQNGSSSESFLSPETDSDASADEVNDASAEEDNDASAEEDNSELEEANTAIKFPPTFSEKGLSFLKPNHDLSPSSNNIWVNTIKTGTENKDSLLQSRSVTSQKLASETNAKSFQDDPDTFEQGSNATGIEATQNGAVVNNAITKSPGDLVKNDAQTDNVDAEVNLEDNHNKSLKEQVAPGTENTYTEPERNQSINSNVTINQRMNLEENKNISDASQEEMNSTLVNGEEEGPQVKVTPLRNQFHVEPIMGPINLQENELLLSNDDASSAEDSDSNSPLELEASDSDEEDVPVKPKRRRKPRVANAYFHKVGKTLFKRLLLKPRIANHFSEVLDKATDLYLEQTVADLEEHAVADGRDYIDKSDYIYIMEKRGLINEKTTFECLARRMPPEVRGLLIPCAEPKFKL